MVDVLIFGDSMTSPAMRHEVPVPVPDEFVYAEHDGRRFVAVYAHEVTRMSGVDTLEVHPFEELGYDELIAQGLSRDEILVELALRTCRELGIRSASVPPTFPLGVADHLRANGIDLSPDIQHFSDRRRVKNESELAGIRRAQLAAEAGMRVARDMLGGARPRDGTLLLDGETLTCERIKAAIGQALTAHDTTGEEFIVAHGAQTAIGHEMGYGPIAPNEPVVIDLFPRDRQSGCYADMTRTFVVGTPPDELVEYHRLTLEALERAVAGVRAGVVGRDLHIETCRFYEEHGYPTQLSKEPGRLLEDGFFHGLGHGVGLEVHEKPALGMTGHEELVAGDVVTLEPGLYRSGFGGCRLEDLVVVGEAGCENLTSFPYDLAPR
ncbi:MAG: aminopeptidase P family protein [Thermoleophilia bacterium]|nr:aminopeptidase P family protein [Thermoleophilia bacterium]